LIERLNLTVAVWSGTHIWPLFQQVWHDGKGQSMKGHVSDAHADELLAVLAVWGESDSS
jgi:hypothetical protein